MATFGYTTTGGSSSFTAFPYATLFSVAEGGDVTKLSVYCRFFGGPSYGIRAAIYANASGSPGAKLAESGSEATVAAAGWIDVPLAYTFVAGSYFLVVWQTAADLGGFAYDAGTTGQTHSRETGATYPTWPDPFASDHSYDNKVSIYATYTASGAGVTYPHLEGGIRGLNRGLMTGLRRAFLRKARLFVPAYNPRGALRAAA